ncbi:MAG: roadblock/LC7 domain-containing protein [Promethearchaeota archaeon]
MGLLTGLKWEDKLKVLIELLSQDPRVRDVKFLSNIGIEFTSTLAEGVNEADSDAMIAAFNALAEASVAEMNLGQIEQISINGTEGYILIIRGQNWIVTLSLPKDARMALIISEINRILNKIGITINIIVALSYFHRKVGPLVFYSYPKNNLDKELSVKIANIMDQVYNEGFFTHSFENNKSMNYYFEIQSDWAHGNKEMLMVSIIISQQISPEVEEFVSMLCGKFAKELQSNEETYTGLYINDLSNYNEFDKERIRKYEHLIEEWVRSLYGETVKEINKTH